MKIKKLIFIPIDKDNQTESIVSEAVINDQVKYQIAHFNYGDMPKYRALHNKKPIAKDFLKLEQAIEECQCHFEKLFVLWCKQYLED
jgi:hypothetical protein